MAWVFFALNKLLILISNMNKYLRRLSINQHFINVSGGKVYLDLYSQVTEADVTATNGAIHVIDHVIVPDRYYLNLVVG